jgi:hypothetical protein
MCRYRACANAIEAGAGFKVEADATNLKDVFDAGIHKLHTEFNIDKDTSATYAYEAMRKRRPTLDAAVPSAPLPQVHASSLAPVPIVRALYGERGAAAKKAALKHRRLEEAARRYDVAQLAEQPIIRQQAAAAKKKRRELDRAAQVASQPKRHNSDLPLCDESDCDDANDWPLPSNWRISPESRRCFQCQLCQTWHRDKVAFNQHGNRRHEPWNNVLHVRNVPTVMWCLRSGPNRQWSPAMHNPPQTL